MTFHMETDQDWLTIHATDKLLRSVPESALDKVGKMVADKLKHRRRVLFRYDTWEECFINGHALQFFGPHNYVDPEKTGAFCQSCHIFHGNPPER